MEIYDADEGVVVCDTTYSKPAYTAIEKIDDSFNEIKRVMKPDANILFCEHGLAPDYSVSKWQNRINPIWGKLFVGCNINRDIPDLLLKAGFKVHNLEQMYLPSTPKIVGYNYWGFASI